MMIFWLKFMFFLSQVNSLGILYYELLPSQYESDGWIVQNPSSDSITTESTCDSNSLFGGFNVTPLPQLLIEQNQFLIRVCKQPLVFGRIFVYKFRIDAMSDGLQVFVNDQYFNFEFLSDVSVSNMCGDETNDYTYPINLEIDHNFDQALIEKLEGFLILKKLLYIAMIVLLQKNLILQIQLLIIIDSLYFITIIQFKVFANKFQQAETIFSESSMLDVGSINYNIILLSEFYVRLRAKGTTCLD